MYITYINHLDSILSVTLVISKETLHFQCERITRLQHYIGAVVVLILTVNHFSKDRMQNISSQTFREMYRHCQHILKYSRKEKQNLKNEKIHHKKEGNLTLEFLLEIKMLWC